MILKSPSIFIGIQGDGYISFGSGQPDLPPPESIYTSLKDYNGFKYGLVQGEAKLRVALAKGYPQSDENNFVVTNGASEAIDLVFRHMARDMAKHKPRARILMHKPYYYSYVPLAKMCGLEVEFTETHQGKIDISDFDEKVRDCNTVLINSPSNPTGRIQDMKTLKFIEKLCKDLDITIISDEVYKDLIYERDNYLLKGNHVVTINSFSKTFSMCGLRVGYLYSNDRKIVDGAIEIKTHSSMNTSIVSQHMAHKALGVDKSFVEKQVRVWKQRRDFICKGLEELGLEAWKPEGAFYVLPKIKDPEKTVMDLFKRHKVITYLGDWFGAPNRIRLSYALDIENIEKGLKRISKCLGS